MRQRKGRIWWLGLIVALVAINLIAAKLHYRADLTEDKRHSLTRSTRALVKDLDEDLQVDVFLKGDFPTGFRKLSSATAEFLEVLKDVNPARIRYRFITPEEAAGEGVSWADSLQQMGVVPINLTVQVASGQQNKYVYPYALLRYKGQSSVVNLYPGSTLVTTQAELNTAESMLEYGMVKALDKLLHPARPFIAYATGHGEPESAETYDLVQTIRQDHEFFTVDLTKQPSIPDTMKVLLVVKPKRGFTESEKLKIDQYIMRGGKVLWAVDNLQAELDSLSYKDQLIAYDRSLNLTDLLFNYGVRINADLLMDLACDYLPFQVGGSGDNSQNAFVRWNYYPLFESVGNHPINKNLGPVLGRFVNTVDTIEVEKVRKTVLLQSSANARTISSPALISPNEVRNTPQDALFSKSGLPAAVLLEGSFSSFYRGRISSAQRDSLREAGGFRDVGTPDGKMIVIGDGDILLNDFSFKNNQPLPLGVNLYTVGSQYEYQFANRNFLLNCLEYLTVSASISEARNKEVVLRSLDPAKVQDQKIFWQLLTIALPIALVILAGAIYQQVRKGKYAKA